MKTTAIFLFLTIFISNIAIAEQEQKNNQRQGPDIDALIVELNLSSDKAEKLKAILKEQREAMQEKRKQGRDNKQEMTREKRQDRRAQMQAQRDAMDEKLLTVLNYEQLYKFRKYMRQFHKTNKGMNKNRNNDSENKRKNRDEGERE